MSHENHNDWKRDKNFNFSLLVHSHRYYEGPYDPSCVSTPAAFQKKIRRSRKSSCRTKSQNLVQKASNNRASHLKNLSSLSHRLPAIP